MLVRITKGDMMPDFAKRFRKEVTEQIGVTSGKANNGFAEYSLNLEGGNMKASLCPVCNGNGQVSNGFYSHPGDYPYWTSGGANTEECRSCAGKGWVEVGNADDRLKPIENITYTLPPDYNNCPSCGGNRNSPALTGCPKGSHYGSYCED